jgi:hypothetical protein
MTKSYIKGDCLGAIVATARLSLVRPAPLEPAPLTYQQEWAWKHFMQPEVPYIVYDTKRFRGPLDIDALCRSFGALVERHECLRTRIAFIDGIPWQRVDEPVEFNLKMEEFSGASSADIEGRADAFLQEFFWRRVNLEAGPLFDVRLLRMGEEDHVLALVIHHLMTDAVSFNLLLRELWIAYEAFAGGRVPNLPAPAIQYVDYAVRQRDEGELWAKRHADYWEKRLCSSTRVTLPRDAGLTHIPPHKVSSVDLPFGVALSRELYEFARQQRATSSTIILSCYVALLSLWSGQLDFVIPYVVSGRFGSSDRNIMGQLGQFLPLRVELTGRETFLELLGRVTREFVGAYEHLDFGRIISDRADLFEGASLNGVLDSLEACSLSQLDSGGRRIVVDPFNIKLNSPEEFRQACDAYCLVWNSSLGLHSRCVYRADLFAAETMRQLLGDLLSLSQRMVRDPTARVSTFRVRARSRDIERNLDAG